MEFKIKFCPYPSDQGRVDIDKVYYSPSGNEISRTTIEVVEKTKKETYAKFSERAWGVFHKVCEKLTYTL